MTAQNPQQTGQCVYCGKYAPLTSDHIPPKNLFAQPRPSNLITVPSCEPCNKAASLDDEYFRLMVSLWEETGEHPEVRKVWPTALRGLTKPNKKGFKKAFFAAIREVRLVTPVGLHLGKRTAYGVDLSRLDRVATRVVKGLFYYEKGFRLPDTHDAEALSAEGLKYAQFELRNELAVWASLASRAPKTIGNEVFSYWVHFLEDDPNCSLWRLLFYSKVLLFGLTLPKTEVGRSRTKFTDRYL